jgi:hypothetical protein
MMMQADDTRENLPRRVSPLCLALLLVACASVDVTAAEVYSWTDENGTMHFSDTPPANGEMATLEVEEIYRPGTADTSETPADAPDAAFADDAPEAASAAGPEEEPAVPLSAAEQRREKIAEDRAERRAQEAETEQLCARHRQRLEQMEPARRVFYTDAEGESVRMDDDLRVELIDESKDYLNKNCRR